jgi:O-antigen ligase
MDQKRWATHPHQVHLEFLSETGIFGYITFLLFFLYSIGTSLKYYINSRNLYQLSAILFISITLLPILPSGSFFTTYGATIFWVNFAIMITYNKD